MILPANSNQGGVTEDFRPQTIRQAAGDSPGAAGTWANLSSSFRFADDSSEDPSVCSLMKCEKLVCHFRIGRSGEWHSFDAAAPSAQNQEFHM